MTQTDVRKFRRVQRRAIPRLAAAAGLAMAALLMWHGSAYGGNPGPLRQIVVQPGQSLWSIASTYFNDDPRSRIQEIETLNGLSGPTLVSGQSLLLPAG